jgi:16S rRNA (cytidine1402-2'-O)-methyltransferase
MGELIKMSKHTLYIVSTPIGNLSDITLRAIDTLKSVSCILCEDTRTSSVLLKHYEINTHLTSYHDYNKEIKEDYIISLLEEGDLALISDAGTPLISDPGYELVKRVILENHDVISIPGASAILSALVSSAILPTPFIFLGFLPRKETLIKQLISKYKNNSETLIFYESPNRILKSLSLMKEILIDRNISVSRELTKKFETTYRFNIKDLDNIEINIKGEFVIIIEGMHNNANDYDSLEEELTLLISNNSLTKDKITEISTRRNINKREVYSLSVKFKNQDSK